jgi:hypothetical protein
MQDDDGMRIAKMTGWANRRLSEITAEDMAAIKRRAHQARSQEARELAGRGLRWVGSLLREAGVAAELGEAPQPYPARYPVPRNRLCR